MLIMSAHEMLTLNATVGDASPSQLDGDSYDAANLCDGDPHNPIRTDGGTFSFGITGSAALSGITGLVVSHHNLDEGLTVGFSGLGNVTTLAVPENGIRLNPYAVVTASGAVSSTTVSLAGSPGNSEDCVIGEVFAGIFREVLSLPYGSGFQFIGYGLPHPGEFGGMAYDKGGEARGAFGGTVYLDDDARAILLTAFRASRNNSRPTVIVPYYEAGDADATSPDAWVVTWEQYEERPLTKDLWEVSVVWREVARLRWPA